MLPFDLLYYVFLHLLPAEVVIIRLVSHHWLHTADAILFLRFNPVRILSPFFNDVPAFRRMMAVCNVIITGSRILHAFRPLPSPTPGELIGLDIFVEDSDISAVYAMLRDNDFVAVADSADRPCELPTSGIASSTVAMTFPHRSALLLHRRFVLRVQRFARGCYYVDVAITVWTPVMAIMSFTSTVDMVFMAWDRFYCIFPRSTAREATGLIPAHQFAASHESMDKTALRGFSLMPWRVSPVGDFDGELGWGCRWLGDSMCWTYNLDVADLHLDEEPARQWQANGFTIRYSRASGPLHKDKSKPWVVHIDACPLYHHTLGPHTYAVPSYVKCRFGEFVEDREYSAGYGWESPSVRVQLISYIQDWFQNDAPSADDYLLDNFSTDEDSDADL